MSPAFDHRDPGTPEEVWQRVAPWTGAQALTLDAGPLVVIAAHPDDETLGAGGLIAVAAARGIPLTVVVVTDGEDSHPADPEIGLRRRHELLDALDELTGGCAVHFLGLPDGGVREAVGIVRRSLRTLVLASGSHAPTVIAPWWGDGHRDHRVVGEVATELTALGARVLGYPIWYWHWADPHAADAGGWRVLALDDDAVAAKARALTRHASQREPHPDAPAEGALLHDGMLRHFARTFEVFVEAHSSPRTSTPVAAFERRYALASDPWGVDVRWYERRKRELLLAALPHERFGSALEIGCGTGALTERLAARCDAVLAVDVAESAVELSRDRLGAEPTVDVRHLDVREGLPDGPFDLVVLSEVGYYWSAAELGDVVREVDRVLTDRGILVVCHWRHPIAEAPLSGDDAHAVIASVGALAALVRHEEEDFVLEVLTRRDGVLSVARETGLIP